MAEGRKKRSGVYFTKETENWIVTYNGEIDTKIKSDIYEKYIHYAFFKLTQNIIHKFKFYHTDVENLEDLQHEVIVFLLSKIHMFDPSRGAKAYSYFGTIVKRYLILYNQKNYKIKVRSTDTSTIIDDPKLSYELRRAPDLSENKELHKDPKYQISEYTDGFVKHCYNNLDKLFKKPLDKKIADAVLQLFEHRENLGVLDKKKAIYLYIREQVDVKTPQITKVTTILQKIFKKGYIYYLENGYIKF